MSSKTSAELKAAAKCYLTKLWATAAIDSESDASMLWSCIAANIHQSATLITSHISLDVGAPAFEILGAAFDQALYRSIQAVAEHIL